MLRELKRIPDLVEEAKISLWNHTVDGPFPAHEFEEAKVPQRYFDRARNFTEARRNYKKDQDKIRRKNAEALNMKHLQTPKELEYLDRELDKGLAKIRRLQRIQPR